MTRQTSVFAGLIFVCGIATSNVALAQYPVAPPPPPPPVQSAPGLNQLTPQMLGQMLQSAATFHDLVEKMNLSKSLGPDEHIQGPDGRFHHPVERTAQVIGAGAGAGAAIGAMTRNPNGMMIGALIGGASGLLVDELLKHREEVAAQAERDQANQQAIQNSAPREFKQREFKQRDHDGDRQTY